MGHSLSQTLITGVYRSGTEFITHLIGCHPDLSVSMYHINVLRFLLNNYDPINLRENYLKAVDCATKRAAERYGIKFDYDAIVAGLSEIENVTYCDIYEVLMVNGSAAHSASNWAEKCQLVWRQIPFFVDNMPNGFAVHVVRDPRAVLASFKAFTSWGGLAYLSAIYNSFDSLKRAVEYKNKRLVILRFEDVVMDPCEVVKVWKMIGLEDLDVPRFDSSTWKDAYGNQWANNSSFQDGSPQDFDSGLAVEAWKAKLSTDEIRLVELICGKYMEILGYQLCANDTNLTENRLLTLIQRDKILKSIHSNFEKTNDGIQAFPSDLVAVN